MHGCISSVGDIHISSCQLITHAAQSQSFRDHILVYRTTVQHSVSVCRAAHIDFSLGFSVSEMNTISLLPCLKRVADIRHLNSNVLLTLSKAVSPNLIKQLCCRKQLGYERLVLDFYTIALNLNVRLFTLYTLSSNSNMVITTVDAEKFS